MKDNPRKYIKYNNDGIFPEPTIEEVEKEETEYNIAFDVMNRLGFSDFKILTEAKRQWESNFMYNPDLCKWDKSKKFENSRKWAFIRKQLPKVEIINKSSGKIILITDIPNLK